MKSNEKSIMVSGKRKTSIAKAKIVSPGSGKVIIDRIPYEKLDLMKHLLIDEPIRIAKKIVKMDFDIHISTRGGGREGRIEAARLALARAILKKTKSEHIKKAFSAYDKHLLVADIRRKEAYKPDDSKARAKRQTSYR
ncbi:30S ribosomal protein S9 [Candidatus Pacearchaeota archaeon]|nr:30S ribosomal protein S9 [Candidatus Pacearchaeota archaeon]